MILIISKKKSQARELSDILDILGILSYPITAKDAFNQISPMYRAVLVIEPSFLADVKDFIDTIHSYVKHIPVYALYQNEIGAEGIFFDHCFTDKIFSASLIYKMADIAREKDIYCPGDYRLAGINASADIGEVLYFEKSVDLTKTEAKILRFLMRSYPEPRKVETIIKYLYKPSKAPEPSSIRTHICKINSKFEKISGERLIQSPSADGYVIYTPELKEKYRENIHMEKVQA